MRLFVNSKIDGLGIDELKGTRRKFEIDEYLFESDSDMASEYLGIITKGVAKMSLNSPEGKSRAIYFLSSYSTIGEMALLNGKRYPHNLTVTAVTPVEVIFLSKDMLLQTFREKPEMALLVLHVLCDKLSILLDYLNGDSFYDAFTMTCHALLALAAENKEIVISHKQLSEIIGINRVTVSIVMKKLQLLGAIEQRRNLVIIKDPAILRGTTPEIGS